MGAMDGQVAQLVLEVSASTALAQRQLNDLARTVQQSTGQMNTALATTDTAVAQNEKAFASIGASAQAARYAQQDLNRVLTRSVDAYAAGFSPVRILTMEMGRLDRVALAMGGAGGTLGGMARFLSGPWGIAIILGVSALAKLIGKHIEAKDSVEALVQKMREHAKEAANSKTADDIWAQSMDGLIDRNEKLTASLTKRLKVEAATDLADLAQARRDEQTANQAISDAQNRVVALQKQLQFATQQRDAALSAGTNEALANQWQARAEALIAQIDAAQKALAKAQQGAQEAAKSITQAQIAVGEEQGKALSDFGAYAERWASLYKAALQTAETKNASLAASATGIAAAFELVKKAMSEVASAGERLHGEGKGTGSITDALNAADKKTVELGKELKDGKITVANYATAMQKLAAALDAVAEAAKNAKKGTGEFGKQVGFADAAAIAKGAGLVVTSGYRSTAHQADIYNDPRYNHPGNPVARPGTSAHEGVNGKWALDIAFAPGLTAESLKKLYGDQGVSLTAVYKESGHFHIEGSRSQAAAADKAAAAAQQKAAVDADQFAKESAQLDAEILAVRRQLLGGYDSQAELATQEVEAQRQEQLAAIQKQLDSKQLTKAEAEQLSLKANELAADKQAVIARRQYVESLDQIAKSAEQVLSYQLDDLKFADEMARTQHAKRQIQLDIVDIQYKQKVLELEHLLQLTEQNADFATSLDLQRQAAELRLQIAQTSNEKSQDQQRVIQGTYDPLEAWAHNIPQTRDEIIQALQDIEARGLDGLSSAISDVIMGTKSLQQAFSELAQSVIGEIIQMTIKMLIFRAISAIFGGGIGGGGFTGDPGNLGVNISAGSVAVPVAGFLASGGPVSAGQAYVVGEDGPELFLPTASGAIIPNRSRVAPPAAANGNGPQEIIVHVSTDQNFRAEVAMVAGQVVVSAAPAIAKATAGGTVRTLRRTRLMGTG